MPRLPITELRVMKQRGEMIPMLTAYDFSMAGIIDSAGIDVILVGDSASNVMAGHETTLPITLEQMRLRAKRPKYSALSCALLAGFGVTLPDWRDALRRSLAVGPAA